MHVPPGHLSEQALSALIEEFITRAGTDYGFSEMPFEKQKSFAFEKIKGGDVLIAYNVDSETTQLIAKDDFQTMLGNS